MSKEAEKTQEKIDIGKRIIAFIGPEGSGKTTIAKKIAKLADKPYVSTGDIIRDLAANDQGDLGEACRKMFEEHTYLPPDLLLKILEHRLKKEDAKGGVILDGGLRIVEETEGFPQMLGEAGINLPLTVIHLRVPAWMGMDRLINGRKRSDDTPEAILSRLSKFYSRLGERAVIIQKQKDWELIHVNATFPPEIVLKNVCDTLSREYE